MNLGNIAESLGDLDDAYEQFTRAFDLLRDQRRHQVGPLAGMVALNLANLLAARGDLDGALEVLPLGVRNAQAYPSWATLQVTARVAHAGGHPETAVVLYGAAAECLGRAGGPAGEFSSQLDHDLGAIRALGSVDVDHLLGVGRQMSEGDALRLAADIAAGRGMRKATAGEADRR